MQGEEVRILLTRSAYREIANYIIEHQHGDIISYIVLWQIQNGFPDSFSDKYKYRKVFILDDIIHCVSDSGNGGNTDNIHLYKSSDFITKAYKWHVFDSPIGCSNYQKSLRGYKEKCKVKYIRDKCSYEAINLPTDTFINAFTEMMTCEEKKKKEKKNQVKIPSGSSHYSVCCSFTEFDELSGNACKEIPINEDDDLGKDFDISALSEPLEVQEARKNKIDEVIKQIAHKLNEKYSGKYNVAPNKLSINPVNLTVAVNGLNCRK